MNSQIEGRGLSSPHWNHEPAVSRETAGDDEDARRAELVRGLPAVDDSTPLAAQLAIDARRRIDLAGRRFPRPDKTRNITVANQQGGGRHTTTTVDLAGP